jgi:uncharacterized lipoprotein YehR (DUF1307 family)
MIPRRKVIGFLAAIAMILSVMSCQTSNDTQETSLDASWSEGFQSLSDMRKASDLIVSGEVVGVDKVTKHVLGEPRWGTEYLFLTDYKFRVDRVIKGASESLIVIRQTGAEGKQEVTDDPLFRIGQQAVLFLRTGDSGTYMVAGGPQGRFIVLGGKVYSLNHVRSSVTVPESLQVNGTSRDTFISNLQ